jgi:hypothetical protein
MTKKSPRGAAIAPTSERLEALSQPSQRLYTPRYKPELQPIRTDYPRKRPIAAATLRLAHLAQPNRPGPPRAQPRAPPAASSPKITAQSQRLVLPRLRAWIDGLFNHLPDTLALPAAAELLRTLGILSDRQTFESHPILNEAQRSWRTSGDHFAARRIKDAVINAVDSEPPTKFGAFARPLIMIAFSTLFRPSESAFLDRVHRLVRIFPHRFELFEPKLKSRLKSWRGEFHGKITFAPDQNRYPIVNRDIPERIIAICKRLRIKAEISPRNPCIVEADLNELLPKPPRKVRKRKAAQDPAESPPQNPAEKPPAKRTAPVQERALVLDSLPDDGEPSWPFLHEDIAIHFRDFPSQPVLAHADGKADLMLMLDVQKYSLPAVRDYVWETLRWARSYPFLTIVFSTGPIVRSPMLGEPQRRAEVQRTIELLKENERVVYSWKIPAHNQSLVICRFKTCAS